MLATRLTLPDSPPVARSDPETTVPSFTPPQSTGGCNPFFSSIDQACLVLEGERWHRILCAHPTECRATAAIKPNRLVDLCSCARGIGLRIIMQDLPSPTKNTVNKKFRERPHDVTGSHTPFMPLLRYPACAVLPRECAVEVKVIH